MTNRTQRELHPLHGFLWATMEQKPMKLYEIMNAGQIVLTDGWNIRNGLLGILALHETIGRFFLNTLLKVSCRFVKAKNLPLRPSTK